MSDVPELRASDADRERAADRLRHAAGVGRLTIDQLDERLNAAYAARTRAELERLVVDVVVEDEPEPAHRMPVRPGDGGAKWLVAIMGGCDRRGRVHRDRDGSGVHPARQRRQARPSTGWSNPSVFRWRPPTWCRTAPPAR